MVAGKLLILPTDPCFICKSLMHLKRILKPLSHIIRRYLYLIPLLVQQRRQLKLFVVKVHGNRRTMHVFRPPAEKHVRF